MEQETSTYSRPASRWDIFCKVIDNYGDIGVSWRLARQLSAEHNIKVCLWIDNLNSFKRINADINAHQSIQISHGIEIKQWTQEEIAREPAEIVIEAFGCGLPSKYIAAMATSKQKPVWINLEYLSAERWIDECHGLPSPHPQLPLIKYFYFPGFTKKSGGLLAEKKWLKQCKKLQADTQLRALFWQKLGLLSPLDEEIRVSLFCYNNNYSIISLFSAWEKNATPVTCLVPEGVIEQQIVQFFGPCDLNKENSFKKGSLTVRILRFLEQEDYDKLLWCCDFNFVRGEDSFVRAQWTGRPMIWQIYPQEAGAHWPKLNAFMNRYCADLPNAVTQEMIKFFEAWNSNTSILLDWEGLWKYRTIMEIHAKKWAESLLKAEDLATSLVKFCNSKLK